MESESFERLRFIDEATDRQSQNGIIEITVRPFAVIQAQGDAFARRYARVIVQSLGDRVSAYAGVAEAATILDVSKTRVQQLVEQGVLASPVEVLAATPLWLTEDVVFSAITRNRSAGRPPKDKI